MKEDLFVLIIGIGRSGTSAVRGYLNLSPDLNIAFEENQMILEDDNRKVYAPPDKFEWGSPLSERMVPYEYNGNKIIFGKNILTAKRIAECIEREKVILHDRFKDLKIVFVTRNREDTISSILSRREGATKEWAEKNWELNYAQLNSSIFLCIENSIQIDFYEFVQDEKIRRSVFDFLGVDYDLSWSYKKINTLAYGISELSMSNLHNVSVDEIKETPKEKKNVRNIVANKRKRKVSKKKSRVSD